jgi:hypothetical protein
MDFSDVNPSEEAEGQRLLLTAFETAPVGDGLAGRAAFGGELLRSVRQRSRRARRMRALVPAGALLAAGGAGALAVTMTASVTTAPVPAHTSAGTASGAHPASTGAPAGSTDAQPPLVKLAADVAAEPRPTGDATLVERETATPGKASINVWDLYTDDGRYFFSQTKAGLPAQVQKDNNQGGGQFGREVAAATYAVTGDLDTAALKMAWPYATPVPAWLSAQVKNMKAGAQIDNYVWEDCQDALVAGSGNPQVRAGVLRLVSALPGITVTYGTVDGQPTLTLTAGVAELGRVGTDTAKAKAMGETGPAYQEAITINADTGIPLKFAGGPAGKAAVTVTYVVKRVNLAGIAVGKF